MRIKNDNPWRTAPAHSGLVDIGTHSLWASVSGPLRSNDSPLLIFITGAGASAAVYVKFQQHLSRFVRVLFYDRAGYDRSTLPTASSPPDDKIYASETARDLDALLRTTHLEPPYLIVGHSFGGIIARSFLDRYQYNLPAIAGAILLDCATELMLHLYPRVPASELMTVAKDVDWETLTHLREQSGMSDAEWAYALAAQQRTAPAAQREDTHASAHQLAKLHQIERQAMGTRPLLVLRFNPARDFRLLYEEGVRLGGGTVEERERARGFVEEFGLFQDQVARGQVRLSQRAVYVAFEEYRHDAPIRHPELIAKEVEGFVERIEVLSMH
ncbi:alpha/beta-hydrolase [Corynespora cassiicola Philippines]|uniref:Alpha/beta-hydrolase n=1 Tax=Corynespora cassiicola Philippines TaxID=1448308 RepID=A0A2T2NBI7_CORCC|nr:alpha/beta-hydrolase [Corynespora cassiicola Philippines]